MPTNRGGGRGSHTAGGVRGTMDAPFGKATDAKKGVGGGVYGHNRAPFDKGQSMGGGSIPTKFFDGTRVSAMPRKATAGQVSPPIGATQNVGNRRFKNPR